ncbi:hypothetical protein J1614_012017 [Plenodomus biglobosus]|nr:hypothetical protein J1614_012017 [Plenodomus biglobosus]
MTTALSMCSGNRSSSFPSLGWLEAQGIFTWAGLARQTHVALPVPSATPCRQLLDCLETPLH